MGLFRQLKIGLTQTVKQIGGIVSPVVDFAKRVGTLFPNNTL